MEVVPLNAIVYDVEVEMPSRGAIALDVFHIHNVPFSSIRPYRVAGNTIFHPFAWPPASTTSVRIIAIPETTATSATSTASATQCIASTGAVTVAPVPVTRRIWL